MAFRFPNVQIVVKVARSVLLSEAVDEGKVDIGLIIDEIDRMPETIWQTLSVKWFSSENQNYLDMRNIPLALFKPPCGFRSLAIRSLDESGIGWRCAYESEDLMSLRSAVQAGAGITVLPYLTEVKGLRSLETVADFPKLPQFGVGLKQREGWNPPFKDSVIELIHNAWTREQRPL
jgi:DNA-binding transcriptional LysR family regulator